MFSKNDALKRQKEQFEKEYFASRETLEKEIWQYAKRQKTWFKRNEKIEWVEVK